ncbi:XkdF-like putative serine protease domain-containing protein [Sinorhizobium fredii]|uniref:XkdF-like putative serine protease domain-containing protein n=1 Tax=Rhizobium fredii TaxID=380 RepID=UPI00309C49CE
MFRSANSKLRDDGGFAAAMAAVPQDTPLVTIKKTDDEQQLVFGEVYAPGFPDSQGDFMTEASIQKMAHEFLHKGLVDKIDVQHSQQESGCYVVESFIAREDDTIFIPGSWVLGVKVPDPQVWSLVKSGELNGFSLDGMGVRVDTLLEIDMPEVLEGETEEEHGHRHRFFVKYDQDGNFLGGWTDVGPDGFRHKIVSGTVTEPANGHAHRFSFVEGVLHAQALH